MLFLTQILYDYLSLPEIPGNLMRRNTYVL